MCSVSVTVPSAAYLDGEEDGEPGKHARRVGLRTDAQLHLFVQSCLEVAGKTVHDAVLGHTELQYPVPTIVRYRFFTDKTIQSLEYPKVHNCY